MSNGTRVQNAVFLAAVAGGLYWASKQPGGVKGVWGRFSPKLKKVQEAENPFEAARQEFAPSNGANSGRIEPVSSYSTTL
jgi:hypothetical protein